LVRTYRLFWDALKENHMKWIFGRAAMWTWATFAVATMAYAAVQNVQLPDGDGKKILQTACTACHGLDGVVNLHLDKDGWEGLVSSMVSNGAQVDSKDYPVLVDYLVKNFGPAKPAGQQAQAGGGSSDAAGKKILEDVCTACHDLDLVSDQHLSKTEWQQIVTSMIAKGANLTDKDSPVLIDYLAKMYPPKK
jgi:sulfite dehydrogenase (cytochrome) subunit B